MDRTPRCSPSRAMRGTCTCRWHIAATKTRYATLQAAINEAPNEVTARTLSDQLGQLADAVEHTQ